MTSRVLYAPRNISGQASEYLASVRPFGYQGEVWSYGEPAFGFPADRVVDQDRLLADPEFRWELFDEAVRSFDIFHLQYSRSLLPPEGVVLPELWDIPLLKSLGKRVIMNFRGSDIRLPSTHIQREPDSYLSAAAHTVDEDRMRARVAVSRRFCDAMLVSTPGLLDDVPDARWLPHVLDTTAWDTERRIEPEVPIVLHVPSSRSTKSSDVVDSEMRSLMTTGAIEYRSLSGVSRSAMKGVLSEADIVIDSLTIGDHGLLSVEAMASGAIAVAHISDSSRLRNPGVPVVEATINNLGSVIQALAADRDRRRLLREVGLRHVRERHDRRVVGAELDDLYRMRVRHVDRAYPDWPRSDSQRRMVQLEQRIDELESEVDGRVRGLGPLRSTLPLRVVESLLAQIHALEVQLEQVTGESAPTSTGGRRDLRPPIPRARDRLKENPAVHRWVRVSRRRLRRLSKR